eukprot:TRINITY_DN18171_c0_g1_i1.p1 TRINITY_DN18171_c0_g1~~TRINITY_DN18171_c0_g1_i1.p1  ORF type:complete len:459 (-),score=96.22 TRINITY_DN18171_c0_g1_i1:551-1927(-)
MANRTDTQAATVHGGNPQYLVDRIVRVKIYNDAYWKEFCFALTTETLIDRAAEIDYVGGTYGGRRRPAKFLCLILKMLQIQPDEDVILEYIKQSDLKYLRALGILYYRLSAPAMKVYTTLEPLFADYRKLRFRDMTGKMTLIHMDELVDWCFREETICDVTLPQLPKRQVLELANDLPLYQSILEDDLDDLEELEQAVASADGPNDAGDVIDPSSVAASLTADLAGLPGAISADSNPANAVSDPVASVTSAAAVTGSVATEEGNRCRNRSASSGSCSSRDDVDVSRSRSARRHKEKVHVRDRYRQRDRERDHERDRDRERERDRERRRERQHRRRSRSASSSVSLSVSGRSRSRERDKRRQREFETQRSKEQRDKEKQKEREKAKKREKEKGREKEREEETESEKEKMKGAPIEVKTENVGDEQKKTTKDRKAKKESREKDPEKEKRRQAEKEATECR